MSVVDNRVVQMTFDNKQFQEGIEDSLKSLQKFEASLDTKDLEKKFNIDGISRSLIRLTNLFDPLAGAAQRAFIRMADSAVNAGVKMVKSLSIDNITAGWDKFGQKTTSVGTLIAQGFKMDEVEDQLERLNWFTDETSYNFTDMVNNIGKFTAAGKGLEESVTAMEGIANWAALSGQNATTASRAMYQISQAMGAGKMRYEDYKSIQNASMDTDEFRQKALDAAVALGKLKKTGKDTYAVINEIGELGEEFTKAQFTTQLTEEGWFNSDVMMRVFNSYSAATNQIKEFQDAYDLDNANQAIQKMKEMGVSVDEFGLKAFAAAQEARTFADVIDSVKDAVSTGFMNMFEIMFGNYEKSKVMFTDMANYLYEVFATPINNINDFLDEAFNKDGGKRTEFIQTLANLGKSLVEIWNLVAESVRNVWEFNGFLPVTVEQFKNLIDKVKGFTEKLVLSDNYIREKLEKTLTGFFSILHIGWSAIKRIGGVIVNVGKKFVPVLDIILAVTAGIGDFFRILDNSISTIGFFNTFMDGTGRVLEYARIALRNFKRMLLVTFDKNPAAKKFYEDHKAIFEGLYKIAKWVYEKIKEPIGKIPELITEFTTRIATAFQNFKMPSIDLEALSRSVDRLREIKNELVKLVSEHIHFDNWFSDFSIDGLGDFFRGLAELTIGKNALEGIVAGLRYLANQVRNTDWSAVISHFFEVFTEVLHLIILDCQKIAKDLVKVYATVMSILFINQTYKMYQAITKFINDAAGLFGLGSVFKNLGKLFKETANFISSLKWKNIAESFLAFAGAIAMIAGTFYLMSKYIDWDRWQTWVSFGAIAAIMAGMYFLARLLSKMDMKNFEGAASSLLGVATAILIIGLTLKALTQFYVEYGQYADQIGAALLTIIGLLVAVATSAGILGGLAPQLGKGAMVIIAMALAVRLLLKPLKELTEWVSQVGDANAGEGIAFLSALLLSLAGAGAIIGQANSGFWKSIGAVAIITAMVGGITKIIKVLSSLTVQEIDRVKESAVVLAELMALISLCLGLLGSVDDGMPEGATVQARKISNITRAASAINSAILGLSLAMTAIFAISKFGNVDDIQILTSTITIAYMAIVGMLVFLSKQPVGGLAAIPAVIYSVTVSMLAIGAAIGVISYIVGQAGIGTGIVSVVGVIGTLITIAAALAKLSEIPVNALDHATKALTIVSVATIAIGFAFSLVKKVHWKQIAAAALGMVATIGVIGLVLERFNEWSEFANDSTGLLKSAGAIAIVSVASVAIGAAYRVMKGIVWSDMIAYAVAMNATLVVMSGALVAVSKFGEQAKMLESSGSLAIMSVVFPVIAGAYKILSTIDFEHWQDMAIMMLATFVTMAGALTLMTGVASVAPGVMLAVAAAMVILSAGLAIAGWGMKEFATAINILMNTNLEGLPKKLADVAEAGRQNAVKIATALSNAAALTAKTMADTKIAYLMGVCALQIIAGFIEGMASGVGMVVTATMHLITELLKAFSDPEMIREAIVAITDFVMNWMTAIGEWCDQSENQEEAKKALGKFIAGFGEFVDEVFTQPAKQMGRDMVDDIWSGIEEKKDEFYRKWYTFLADLAPTGPIKGSSVAKMGLEGFLGGVGAYKAGGNVAQGIGRGIRDNAPEAVSEIANLAKKLGITFTTEEKIKSPSKVFAQYGKYIVEGLAVGISDNSKSAEKAMVQTAKDQEEAYCNYMGIHSPADVFIEKGKELINGLVQGVRERSELVDDLMAYVGENNITSFEDGVKKAWPWLLAKIKEKTGGLGDALENGLDPKALYEDKVKEFENLFDSDAYKVEVPEIDTSSMDSYTYSLDGLDNQMADLSLTQTNWMSQLEANGPIMDQTTRGLYAMTDATEALNQTTGDTSKSMEEVMKNFHKIEKVDRVMLGAKALEYYDDYYKLKKAGILDGSRDDFKDYFTGKENVTGVKGYWQLISNMQEEFAKERADLFTRGDIDKIYDDEFKKYLHENMSRYQYDWTYMRGVVPTWTNDWIDAQGFKVTQEQIDQMMNAVPAQNGAYGYGGYGMDYTSYLSTLTNDVDAMNAKLNDIYTRINQLQVVLDTGAIAGAVMQPVDNYIGTKMVYAARGMI